MNMAVEDKYSTQRSVSFIGLIIMQSHVSIYIFNGNKQTNHTEFDVMR